MFTSAQNLAIVRTELDGVFYQEFNYTNATPSQMSALTAAIFKPLNTTHKAYIEEVFKGSELFKDTGETEVVGSTTPKVANKLTTYVKDFTQSIELSKDLFDDKLCAILSSVSCSLSLAY